MRNQCFLILLSLMFVSQGLPAQLLLDDIDHITARSTCSDAVLTDDFTQGQENASLSGECRSADKIFVCPGEYVQFGLRHQGNVCLLYTSPSPRDATLSRMPSSA